MGATTNAVVKPEVPRTFADVYEDEKLLEQTLKATEVFKRCIENILFSAVNRDTKRSLMLQCIEEFFQELDEPK